MKYYRGAPNARSCCVEIFHVKRGTPPFLSSHRHRVLPKGFPSTTSHTIGAIVILAAIRIDANFPPPTLLSEDRSTD